MEVHTKHTNKTWYGRFTALLHSKHSSKCKNRFYCNVNGKQTDLCFGMRNAYKSVWYLKLFCHIWEWSSQARNWLFLSFKILFLLSIAWKSLREQCWIFLDGTSVNCLNKEISEHNNGWLFDRLCTWLFGEIYNSFDQKFLRDILIKKNVGNTLLRWDER